jgi:acetyltransferase-like isoleucine patch superfamily enzyme
MIAKTAVVYPHVKLGKNVIIEDYCVIGAPLRDGSTPETVIGDNSHLRSFTVIYSGNVIGQNFQTGNKANIRENNKIGNNVSVGTLSVVEHQVVIEDGVRIHTNCFVPEFSVLKKNCWLGPHVVLTNAKYPNRPDTKNNLIGPTVEAGAVIGANSTISPGVNIGAGSIVGSGTNVTQNVNEQKIVVGNPARVIRGNNK